MWKWLALSWALASPVPAQTVVAERAIRAQSIITELDVTLRQDAHARGFSRVTDVIGQEAAVAIYPGRPLLIGDVVPPALVARNQIVKVSFWGHGLQISTEGRALERGAAGDHIRFMNLSSRTTVTGVIQADGTLRVER